MIPPGAIDELTRLVLANAIYFNAKWKYPFQEDLTQYGPFHLLDGSQVTVPFMSQAEMFRYGEGEDYQAIALAYVRERMAMLILLPKNGQFEAFEEGLTAERVDEIFQSLKMSRVAVSMPKFEYESKFELSKVLAEMGMPSAFANADFSGMDGTRNLFISKVLHKAFVSVDEAGTEAAAATAVVIREMAAIEPSVEMSIDHPFIFMIRDLETGTILFVGKLIDPTG